MDPSSLGQARDALAHIIQETHPVQLLALASLTALNVVLFRWLNHRKGFFDSPHVSGAVAKSADSTEPQSPKSWEMRRNCYCGLALALMACAWSLDCHFPISRKLWAFKTYVFAFPLALLDLHFSNTNGITMWTLAGAALWCSSLYVRDFWIVQCLGDSEFPDQAHPTGLLVREFSLLIVLREVLRYVLNMAFVGLLTDLVFSPMHRLTHHRLIYKHHHKAHHEFTNDLTALVLFHGEFLDSFLMPLCTAVGGFVYRVFVVEKLVNPLLQALFDTRVEPFSNATGYPLAMAILLSHAHDVRCARLVAPFPDSLNFIAYHYQHHLNPAVNFGLTQPSDMLWDWILGVKTMHTLEEAQKEVGSGSPTLSKADESGPATMKTNGAKGKKHN